MSKKRMRIIIAAAIFLVVVGLAAVLSWRTTATIWDGEMLQGEWSIRVQNHQGIALADAYLSVITEDGESVSYGDYGRGPFDNYTAPGDVRADDGVLRLRNTRRLKVGGTFWELFWIWRIGSYPDPGMGLVFKISAPGYEAATVSFDDLLSQNEITIALGTKE